ncbi:MAG TPA: metalloregulator ArsR/SmtB family transcription factor [Tepidisphaeraceae bacterium]|nr:metalloregulator ArsR/SmtB family transcription factor [Tepidisphaeraceae bacterium]
MSQDLEPLVSLFRLLSDKTRVKILFLLTQGERNVSSLCQELRLPQPTVSHHLGLLRSRNLITNRRNGKQVFYGFNGEMSEGEQGTMTFHAASFKINVAAKSGA